MIIHPKNWQNVGKQVTIADIDNALNEIISGIDCINISFSGGVDSCLLLHYLLKNKGRANAFTVANDAKHPDIEYSCEAIKYYEHKYATKISHHVMIRPKVSGDDLVKSYYGALACLISSIIAGDCIDELACGYYKHQDLQEETYQNYLQRLQAEHLEPLNRNSGKVMVYLPFADDRITNLFHCIPLYHKVDLEGRKLIIMELAEGKVPTENIERRKYGLGTSIHKIGV